MNNWFKNRKRDLALKKAEYLDEMNNNDRLNSDISVKADIKIKHVGITGPAILNEKR
ncbi:hypothetical protein [Bacillus sp. FJAT-49736]|uniref:hypothetical protein n=1 Tax=Bacillus sp. FJAT-49736 TaxID=2833582 RepID=UPI001BCA40F5|nr:hypothetical protein [Bacillus sp. FJAT-49736]MBS4174556.1 hypothetical protein [Bacillus sp. FJAT-49736]